MATSPESTLMYAEAAEAAAAVEKQFRRNENAIESLAQRLRNEPPGFAVTCARGSSNNAATFAKALLETQLGCVTASASLSVGSVYRARQNLDGALYIAISQSGKSPDLVQNARAARDAGAYVVALVNVEDSPLAETADAVIPLHAGPERSVAATKTYICSLAAILHLVARWTRDAELTRALTTLPKALDSAFQQDWSSFVDGLVAANDLFVLGRGLGLCAAQEAALKCKETSALHAEAYSSAEVKHGPMTLVGQDFPVLLLAQDDATLAGALDTAKEFRERGGRVWQAAPNAGAGSDTLPVATAPHPFCAPLLAITSFYRAVNALALARGHNPDVPPHLNKVTETV